MNAESPTDKSSDPIEPNQTVEASPEAEASGTPLEAELETVKKDMLYLRAEFENYKRNAIKERSDLIKYGHSSLVRELLSVIDNLERALGVQVSTENVRDYIKGVELTSTEFKSVLQRFGVFEISAEGQAFDPAIHEALGNMPSPNHEPGHVANVIRKGYKLHDRVVRPSQVMVAAEPNS